MGQLKEQLFLQHLNQSLANVRSRFRNRHAAKKNDRFMVKGITYEIGPCRVEGEEFAFEISSKIPAEMLPEKVKKERFFNEVVKMMKKQAKKPTGSRMENIVSATQEEELKERDYVNLTYRFKEKELYTGEMVTQRLKQHQTKHTPIPAIPGIATPAGRVVMVLVEESIDEAVTRCVNALIESNEKGVISLGGSFSRSVARKKTVATKPAAQKPAVKKPVAKKPAATKPVAKKPVAKKAVAKKPVAKKPVAKKPAAKKPAAKKAVAKKPTAKKPAAKKKK